MLHHKRKFNDGANAEDDRLVKNENQFTFREIRICLGLFSTPDNDSKNVLTVNTQWLRLVPKQNTKN